jgi:hypothetical protein
MVTFDDVDGFFGYIAVPDHHQLNVEEIGPHQAEGEKEFADVVEVGILQRGNRYSDSGA